MTYRTSAFADSFPEQIFVNELKKRKVTFHSSLSYPSLVHHRFDIYSIAGETEENDPRRYAGKGSHIENLSHVRLTRQGEDVNHSSFIFPLQRYQRC